MYISFSYKYMKQKKCLIIQKQNFNFVFKVDFMTMSMTSFELGTK